MWVSLGALLLGCPIYSDNPRCMCPGGSMCSSSGTCGGSGTCRVPSDCAEATSCASDGRCYAGDCLEWGCPTGYACLLPTWGTPVCVDPNRRDAGVFDGGRAMCQGDVDCGTSGSRCLSGSCVNPADQCSDGTQCVQGSQCVDGACTPSCDATHSCPTGYGCDTPKGVCTGNPKACAAGAAICSSGTLCVQDHCVLPCAGGTCSGSLICVDGGCMPDQKPRFVCQTDGASGTGSTGSCALGSVCLHHSCYIACDRDAGTTACRASDQLNVCKQVTSASGTYAVCGSDTNLGSECDLTLGKPCLAGRVCIDGTCK